MRKAFFAVGFVAVASTAGLSLNAVNEPDVIRANTFVGTLDLGGLTPEEAAKQMRIWWEAEKLKKLKLESARIAGLPEMKPNDLGIAIDDVATVQQLPLQPLLGGGDDTLNQEFKPRYKPNGIAPTALISEVAKRAGKPKAATVRLVKGAYVRTPETSTVELDQEKLFAAVTNAIYQERAVTVPLKEGAKTVSDEDLKKIRQVVAEFSTKFSSRNKPRSNNIKLATEKIDGLVLAPGERFSFNGSVGQRTTKAGFREAGVYINGRHDTGIGGGICQVSTTLYNAALFSNMKVVKRTNHSLPVPYVPVGRDATVNWGAQDLVLENNFDHPIALSATYAPGKLTFRVLGQKQPGLEVKIEREGLKSWRAGTKTVKDSGLTAGRRKVVESGSTGYSVNTFRLIYENGQLVKKEPLGRSYYPGSATIVAVGTKAKPAPAPPAASVQSESDAPVPFELDPVE
jgi:vancomycin resistance protein YoaR